jgi:hypothetical protein
VETELIPTIARMLIDVCLVEEITMTNFVQYNVLPCALKTRSNVKGKLRPMAAKMSIPV